MWEEQAEKAKSESCDRLWAGWLLSENRCGSRHPKILQMRLEGSDVLEAQPHIWHGARRVFAVIP